MKEEILTIRIVKVPEGDAPYNIRENWVGLEFKAKRFKDMVHNLSKSDLKIKVKEGYEVLADEAIEKIGQKSKEAALWFRHFFPKGSGRHLIFRKDEAKIISSETILIDKKQYPPDPFVEAAEKLGDILKSVFPKMAKAYGVSGAKGKVLMNTPELLFNFYIGHNFESVSTIQGQDVSLSTIQFVYCLMSGNEVVLVETLGEELGHILRNALRKNEPGDLEFRKKGTVDRCLDKDRKYYQIFLSDIDEFFGWVGRIVFRNCFDAKLKLSHEIYLESGIEPAIKAREKRIKKEIKPAIKEVKKLGKEVGFSEEGFLKYKEKILGIAYSLMGEGYDSDNFFDREIWGWFKICDELDDALDFKLYVEECIKYLTMADPKDKYEAEEMKEYREKYYPKLFELVDKVSEDTFRQKVLGEVIKERTINVNSLFEKLPVYLREKYDLSDFFIYFYDTEHQEGYRTVHQHMDEILKDLPHIVRMSDRETYERFFQA